MSRLIGAIRKLADKPDPFQPIGPRPDAPREVRPIEWPKDWPKPTQVI